MWPVEKIPDVDNLFMRIHRNLIRDGEPMPGAFRDNEGGMSTDWSKYATADQTRSGGRQDAELYGVIKMQVGGVRSIKPLTVAHAPLDSNQAHTDVFGEKDTEVRLKLCRICVWQINCADL